MKNTTNLNIVRSLTCLLGVLTALLALTVHASAGEPASVKVLATQSTTLISEWENGVVTFPDATNLWIATGTLQTPQRLALVGFYVGDVKGQIKDAKFSLVLRDGTPGPRRLIVWAILANRADTINYSAKLEAVKGLHGQGSPDKTLAVQVGAETYDRDGGEPGRRVVLAKGSDLALAAQAAVGSRSGTLALLIGFDDSGEPAPHGTNLQFSSHTHGGEELHPLLEITIR
jgi:hypothetical protein